MIAKTILAWRAAAGSRPFQVSIEQWIQLVQGYQLEVRANGRYAKTQIDSVKESRSDWVQWNKERDLALQR